MNPRKSPPRVTGFNLLYLSQRYLPLLDRVILDLYFMLGPANASQCASTYHLSTFIALAGVAISESLLSLRIWAVWHRSRMITAILFVMIAGLVVPALFFLIRFLKGVQFPDPTPIPGIAGFGECFYFISNKEIVVCWALLMVYDAISFALMAVPGFKAFRLGGQSHLVKVVYRDGVMYYGLIFLVSLINVIIIVTLPLSYATIISPFERILHSVLASRAILHIRKAASEETIQGRSTCEHGVGSTIYIDMMFVDTGAVRTGNEPELLTEES
ncbi:hypothetical protein PM082_002020 [Marasmius tenuissimus]|nr:hypothetical protein PM082_002020 [Marasmius tenuissimus]